MGQRVGPLEQIKAAAPNSSRSHSLSLKKKKPISLLNVLDA